MRAIHIAVFLSLIVSLLAQEEMTMDRSIRNAHANWLVPYPRVGKRSLPIVQHPSEDSHPSPGKRLYLARVGKRAYMYAARVGK